MGLEINRNRNILMTCHQKGSSGFIKLWNLRNLNLERQYKLKKMSPTDFKLNPLNEDEMVIVNAVREDIRFMSISELKVQAGKKSDDTESSMDDDDLSSCSLSIR